MFLLTLSALSPIVNPLAGSPLFSGDDSRIFTTSAESACLARFPEQLSPDGQFLFCGCARAELFGVSLPAVQVGGGLIVVAMGWSVLLEKNESPETARRNVKCSDVLHSAFYPLTLPLTVGPGSISVAVTLGANSTHHYGFHVGIIIAALLAMAAVAISVLLCYGLADQLARVIGKTGMVVIVRLSSFLLVCIGVQIMWNGISALVSSLHL